MGIVFIGWGVTGIVNFRNLKKQKLIDLKMKSSNDYKKAYMDLVVESGIFDRKSKFDFINIKVGRKFENST